jgi:hypothetical protein
MTCQLLHKGSAVDAIEPPVDWNLEPEVQSFQLDRDFRSELPSHPFRLVTAYAGIP